MPLTLDDFDYQLPDELIARYPLAVRSASRLLYLPAHGQPKDQQFVDLPELLNSGDLVVFNDTKVMKARLPRLRRITAGLPAFNNAFEM